VIAPEKVPLAVALAEPANSVIMKTAAARAAMIRPGRKLTDSSPDFGFRAPCAHENRRAYTPIYLKWNLLLFRRYHRCYHGTFDKLTDKSVKNALCRKTCDKLT